VKGYVPGYDGVLGHEFVGVVASCPACPAWEGRRVVGEINCPRPTPPAAAPPPSSHSSSSSSSVAAILAPAPHPATPLARNHAPDRTVLGIIGRDGCAAEWVVLPAACLHRP